jgi:probable HAF family extracellular repeat protein
LNRTTTLLASLLSVSPPLSAQAHPVYECTWVSTSLGDVGITAGINRRGDIVGKSTLDGFEGYFATWWRNVGHRSASLRQAPPDLAVNSVALDINDSGVIAGAIDFDAMLLPVIWNRGDEYVLPSLTKEPTPGQANAINRIGDVVGQSRVRGDTDTSHAVLWRQGGVAIDLGALGRPKDRNATWSTANDINAAGQIVGSSDVSPERGRPHAVRWNEPSTIIDLGTLPGGARSVATAINRSGLVVGGSEFGPSADYRATAWTRTGIRDLGTLPGHVHSMAWAVNDHGVAVGESGGGDPATQHAAVWFDPAEPPVALSTLVDERGCTDSVGRPYLLLSATGINQLGSIAAYGVATRPDGRTRYDAFRLTPR